MLGSAESEQAKLISHEIIFEKFQPTVCDNNTSTSWTDGSRAVRIWNFSRTIDFDSILNEKSRFQFYSILRSSQH